LKHFPKNLAQIQVTSGSPTEKALAAGKLAFLQYYHASRSVRHGDQFTSSKRTQKKKNFTKPVSDIWFYNCEWDGNIQLKLSEFLKRLNFCDEIDNDERNEIFKFQEAKCIAYFKEGRQLGHYDSRDPFGSLVETISESVFQCIIDYSELIEILHREIQDYQFGWDIYEHISVLLRWEAMGRILKRSVQTMSEVWTSEIFDKVLLGSEICDARTSATRPLFHQVRYSLLTQMLNALGSEYELKLKLKVVIEQSVTNVTGFQKLMTKLESIEFVNSALTAVHSTFQM